MRNDDPLAVAGAAAIHTGDLAALQRLLAENPGLAKVQIEGRRGGYRTPLHAAADWPGYFPNGPAVVRLLLANGADPNGGAEGFGHQETPLHWAASSDDVDVAEALIDGGADIEAPGGSIAGGTPLDNAVGYGCWRVARLLVLRGARVDKLWHAAALGTLARVEELLPGVTSEEINNAFWQACHGGQRRAAELLLAHGADLNWVPDYAKGTPLEIAGSIDTGRAALVTWLQENGAQSASKMPTPVRGLVDQDGVPLVTVSRVHRHLSAMFDKQTDSESGQSFPSVRVRPSSPCRNRPLSLRSHSRLAAQGIEVMRARCADDHLSGPFSGARLGQVVAYDFELPTSFEPWPGRTRRERTFVLLDLGVSFANPCWVRHTTPDGTIVDRVAEGPDTWYVDLVTVERNGNTFTFRDLYIDVMVPMDGRHHRLLDLHEFADALDRGVLSARNAADALRRWQRFLDRHLHADRAPSNTWTDFPPSSIRPLMDLQSFEELPAQTDF